MCLTVFIKPKIARKDIIVYKVVVPMRKNSRRFEALYYPDFIYELGKTHSPKDIYCLRPRSDTLYNGIVKLEFNQGLHSYATLSQTASFRISTRVVLECCIPKGTQYVYDKIYGEYVSLALRVNKVIK